MKSRMGLIAYVAMYPLVNVYIWKITMLFMGKSTTSIAIVNSKLQHMTIKKLFWHNQRVNPIKFEGKSHKIPLNLHFPMGFPMVFLLEKSHFPAEVEIPWPPLFIEARSRGFGVMAKTMGKRWFHGGFMGFYGILRDLPVNIEKTLEHHHFRISRYFCPLLMTVTVCEMVAQSKVREFSQYL